MTTDVPSASVEGPVTAPPPDAPIGADRPPLGQSLARWAAIAAGAPPFLAAIGLAVASTIMGGLTHYASGPAPVLFGAGYMPVVRWWRIGLVASIVSLTIFGTVGALWTKVLWLW